MARRVNTFIADTMADLVPGSGRAAKPRRARYDLRSQKWIPDYAVGEMRNQLKETGTTIVVGTVGVVVQISTALASLVVARSVDPATYGQVAYFFSLFRDRRAVGQHGL